MRRKSMNRKSSKRNFTRNAMRSHRTNNYNPKRGGIRL